MEIAMHEERGCRPLACCQPAAQLNGELGEAQICAYLATPCLDLSCQVVEHGRHGRELCADRR